MLAGITYELRDGVFYVECTTVMSNVELMIEGCDEYPDGFIGEGQEVIDCTNDFDKHKKYYWLQISAEDMIIDADIESNAAQNCIVAFLPNKDDFWVLGQSVYTDYYVVHEPTRSQVKFAPSDLRKKPKLRNDSLPPEEFLNLFTWGGFTVKILAYLVFSVAAATVAIVVMDGKQWGGIGFLNKDDWDLWTWLKTNIFVCF